MCQEQNQEKKIIGVIRISTGKKTVKIQTVKLETDCLLDESKISTGLPFKITGQCYRTMLQDNVTGQCYRTMLQDSVIGEAKLRCNRRHNIWKNTSINHTTGVIHL